MPKLFFACSLGVLFSGIFALPAPAQTASNAVNSSATGTIKVSAAAPVPPAIAAADDKAAWETDETINSDLLKMEVVVSRTAQIFHVVDQLSQWNKNTHKQYISYFGGANGSEFSDDDRLMLAKHVAVREKHPWGQGLEQTFYSPLSIKAAADEGVAANRLTAEEAAAEVEVMNYFAPRIDPLIQKEMPTLTKFRETLNNERVSIAMFVRQLSRFCGNRRYKASVYLIVNPHEVNHGSGFGGNRMILEVPRNGDAYTTLMRNLLAVFIEQYTDEMNKAIAGVDELDYRTLEDSLANALVPGLLRVPGAEDVLLNRVARDLETKKPLTDPQVRTQRYALMLRPALSAALADKNQTLSTFLPHAIDIWRSLNELQRAATTTVSQYRASKAPSIFIFGNLDTGMLDYFQTGSRNLFSRPHAAEAYQELIGKYAKPNDTVILLATSSTLSHIPTPYADLLPLPIATVQERLAKGETVVMQGTARQLKVVLLAAPGQILVDSLVRSNRALWQ